MTKGVEERTINREKSVVPCRQNTGLAREAVVYVVEGGGGDQILEGLRCQDKILDGSV